MQAIIHKKTGTRGFFDYYGADSWTICPSMEHYRCIQCFVPSTGATFGTDTLKLLGHDIPIPKLMTKTHCIRH
eukprot:1583865-Ditylum_brightwellii.AAC.1